MTMISLAADILPKAIKDPSSTDMGKVMTIIEGKANTKIRKAAHMDAPY
jgi:hypothetical protein